MRLSEDSRSIPDESVVPLINVVFLLLVFFLLVGTLAPAPDLELELARAFDSPPTEAPSDALYAAADGRLSYRGALIERGDLAGAVQDAEEPFRLVLDRGLTAEDLAPILGALADGGVNRVEIVSLRSDAP